MPETISNPSPKPKNTSPTQRYNKVFKEGLKLVGDLELQDNLGIFLIFRNIDLSIKCPKCTQPTYCSILINYGVKKFF